MKSLFIKLKGYFVFLLMIIHSLFWCSLLFLVFLPKIFVRKKPRALHIVNTAAEWLGHRWVNTNDLLLKWVSGISIDITGDIHLDKSKQYFVTCNHQFWSDILILQHIFVDKISFVRFFIKKELMWLPVLNIAWWAYDYPIMYRASKKQLEKNPELRSKDMQTTQKACKKFKNRPLTLLNFLEGTRFTSSKHQRQNSPYQYLLKPKAGGLAYALEALDHQVVNVIDVTIVYPKSQFSFVDFLGGAVSQVKVHWCERTIPNHLLTGSYAQNMEYRKAFQDWVANIWSDKDQLIKRLKSE